MKVITLKQIEELEHKIQMIMHPLILKQIRDFVHVYLDRDDVLYPKALQLIAIEVARIGRDLHDKDLI
jgi:hypothetical protein